MWPDRISNPGALAHESDALPTAHTAKNIITNDYADHLWYT